MTVRRVLAIVSLTCGAVLLGASSASPAAAQSFTCVLSNANTCVVTIPLTSNMDETVTSTMPDTQPWTLSEAGGDGTVNPPYELTNDACGGDFDGGCGSTEGHVWTAILTTGPNEPPGGAAVLTFVHVTSDAPAKPYTVVSYSAPNTAVRHQPVTITGTAKPKPAKGHFVMQSKSGSSWKTVETLVYKSKLHAWSTTFTWTAAKHATITYRLEATAAPGLLATPTSTFKIRTA